MSDLQVLFENNQQWADALCKDDPDFFKRGAAGQSPKYLWIGCADSRVPACQITGLKPGEMFVHRNIANLVVPNDINALSVIQYAVEHLKVEHVIVCGHTGCGGVKAACGDEKLGLLDGWLQNIKNVYQQHKAELDAIADTEERLNKLCERNVAAQVRNVCRTDFVQEAWRKGQKLSVHGIVYDLAHGLLKDLSIRVDNPAQVENIDRMAS